MRVGVSMLAFALVAACGSNPGLGEAPSEIEPVATVETIAAPGGTLSAHVFRHPQTATSTRPAPAVLLFHGGAWEAGDPAWVSWNAQQFAKRGMVAIAVQYRLIDMSKEPSQRATIVDAVADACAAFRWARAQPNGLNLDPYRIAGYGVSAGGHLAAMAGTGGCGTDGRADALVLISPAVDPRNQNYYPRKMPVGADAALLDAYSPIDRIRAGEAGVPTLILNGESDIQTPAESALGYCVLAAAKGHLCRVQVFPGLGHLLTADLEAQQRGQYPPNFEANAAAQAMAEAFLSQQGYW
jgi:acetyl esterase/lipase